MGLTARALLDKRRKRLQGSILGFCERSGWYDELDRDEKEDLRQKVLDSIAAFYDDVLDVVKALEEDTSGVTNQAVWDLLCSIQDAVTPPALPTGVPGARTG